MNLKEIILVKNKKKYIIEDEQGVFFQCNTSFISFFCTEKNECVSFQLHFVAEEIVVQKE